MDILDPNLFEGDMILTPDQLTAIKNGEFNRDLPLAATRRPWPKLIPYDLFGLSKSHIFSVAFFKITLKSYPCIIMIITNIYTNLQKPFPKQEK